MGTFMGEMTAQEAAEWGKTLSFETVWAALMEGREQQKETERIMKENAEGYKEVKAMFKDLAEQQRKTDEQMKKTDEQMKKTDEQLGGLHNRFGELAEHLVAPGIHERFNEMGYHFGAMSPGGQIIRGEDGKIKAEIDLLLENGETVMAVEVKATVKLKHIEEHIKRLEILSAYRRKWNDSRKVEGAMAGAIFGVEEKKAVLEAGFYVIEQSGDTMKIEVPDGFTPRRW